MQSKNYFRIALMYAEREGWHADNFERPALDAGSPELAVIAAASMFRVKLRGRADDRDFVFLSDSEGIWGVGRVLRVMTRDDGKRGFLVDPCDVPTDVAAMVGSPRPDVGRALLAYGLLVDGKFLMDSSRAEERA